MELLLDVEESIGILVDLVPLVFEPLGPAPEENIVGVGDLRIVSSEADSDLALVDDAGPVKCLDRYLAALEVGVVPLLPYADEEEEGDEALPIVWVLSS